jgi:hypothetical protein
VLCCQLLTELSGLFGRKIQSLKKKSCPINNFSLFGVILICTTEENLKFKVLYVCDKIQPQIFQICDICPAAAIFNRHLFLSYADEHSAWSWQHWGWGGLASLPRKNFKCRH